ncbi:hypothetical protein LTS15_006248 [Exophiala xenobiotica]|nr:hypothetical protein LTS15_006248 [Exophiala xenobiotica]
METKQVRVVRLTHVVYQHPDVYKALKFLFDFSFVEAQRTDKQVYLHGWLLGGRQPRELEKAASRPNASSIEESAAPGGGKVVTVEDPHGHKVGFVHGQTLREDDRPTLVEKTDPLFNGAAEKPRRGAFRRFKQAPSPVHKLGHYGFVVPASQFESTRSFYTNLMNLKATDAV